MHREPSPDETFVDLHGVTLDAVRIRLEQELRRAHLARTKRVLFIHGAGNHSETGDAPLAAAVRAYLKELLDTPRSVVRRLDFGEDSSELGHNRGCVRAWIALEVAWKDAAFVPRPPSKPASKSLDRRRSARRTLDALTADERNAIDAAGELLRRRFGAPDTERDRKAPGDGRGPWPGQR